MNDCLSKLEFENFKIIFKQEIKNVWSSIENQLATINNIVNEKKINWTNLQQVANVLTDVNNLEINLSSLKDKFRDIKIELVSIKNNQENWSKLQKKTDLSLDNIKKNIAEEKIAREKRNKNRKEEWESRIIKRKKERKNDFHRNLIAIATFLTIGLSIMGLFVTDKNQAQRNLINQRDSIQSLYITDINNKFENYIKIINKKFENQTKINLEQTKTLYEEILKIIKKE
ncbi:MAG: hypothetical protein ACTSXT_13740 [Candidatus Helarchaeota archaeon]